SRGVLYAAKLITAEPEDELQAPLAPFALAVEHDARTDRASASGVANNCRLDHQGMWSSFRSGRRAWRTDSLLGLGLRWSGQPKEIWTSVCGSWSRCPSARRLRMSGCTSASP